MASHEHAMVVFLEVAFEILQLFIELSFWLNDTSLTFGIDMSFMEIHLFLLHELSDDKERASGRFGLTVYKDVVFFDHGSDVRVDVIKMGVYAIRVIILKINPLAVLDFIRTQQILDL